MRKRLEFTLIAALLMLLVLPGLRAAFAENGLPRPFAPWMSLENELIGTPPDALERTSRAAPVKKSRTARAVPDSAVITPEQTRALADQLENGADLATLLEKPSALEELYSRRADEPLKQFGYDLFGRNDPKKTGADRKGDEKDTEPGIPSGAVQDSFILNIGDRLDVTFRGQHADRKTYTITGEGLLLIDDLPPITAAGRSIGEVRDEVQAQTSLLHNTEAFVSLESVRQVSVLVVGHVKHPGRKTLTVFDGVLDALARAGGVDKAGSLRQIKLVRDGRNVMIDLYGLLVHGNAAMDLSLRDGDRIIVPTIGPALALSGSVKRPGIYEILPALKDRRDAPLGNSQVLSLQDMLELGGGLLHPGRNRFLKMNLTGDGQETVEDIGGKSYAPLFSDGSILIVEPDDEKRTGTVALSGETRRPGLYALDRAPNLSLLIKDEKIFGPDIYPLIGVIERWNPGQLAHQMIAFPPLLVLKGQFDRKLQDGDVVHLFSRAQMLGLQKPQTGRLPVTKISLNDDDDEDMIADPVLTGFLRERSAFVRGAVRQPGAWPVAEGATLENMIAVSGGLALEADTANIEVATALQYGPDQVPGGGGTRRTTINMRDTDSATVMLEPGDSVRVNQKFRKVEDNSVLIIGQVASPGRYDLLPGDKFSDLLARAGGPTLQAYPDGAIFSRESERRAEEARFKAEAHELELRLASTLRQNGDKDKIPAPEEIGAVQSLINQLKRAEALGRITVEANPGILKARPDEDILLESGDRIFIPQRPLTVRVAGEVLSPASLQFRKDKDPRNYIMEAGGFTYNADKDRSFVIYPDGSAQPLQVNDWNRSAVFIPPGSTIIVPRDPKPFDFIQTAKDVSQILSNLAITGIFIDNIRNGN